MSKLTLPHNYKTGYPSPRDKYEVAELWSDVFHDSPEYIELFFNRVYKPENTLVIKRDGFIVSALQMIPYQLKIKKRIISVAYVCGVGTHPWERGKGLMRFLMRKAISEMEYRGYEIAIVIPSEPSLFDYYRKFKFRHPIDVCTGFHIINDNNLQNINDPYTIEACTKHHYPYFDRKQRERKRTILHDAYDFETILQEIRSDGGEAFVALENNIPAGMAFARKTAGKTTLIKEIFYDNDTIYQALYRHAGQLFDAEYIKIILPKAHYQYKIPVPYGLVRYINRCPILIDLHMSLMLD